MRPDAETKLKALEELFGIPSADGHLADKINQLVIDNENMRMEISNRERKEETVHQQILHELSLVRDENKQLRQMLAHTYTGSLLYQDDGELQDQNDFPYIDFKRDPVGVIQFHMKNRAIKEIKNSPVESELTGAYKRDVEKALRAIKVASEFVPELKQSLSPASAISSLAYLLAQARETGKPKVYATFDTEGTITLSAYSVEYDKFETNHIELVELRNGKPNVHESVLNILRNVLFQAHVTLEIE